MKKLFPAFLYKNYRIYFVGHLISLIGTWLQQVAQGYLVYEITDSAYWVGGIAALNTIPVMLFSLFGGIVVDRFKKRDILTITQTSQMILAFILGVLTLTGHITPVNIAILSFLLGMCIALDMPARQTFVHSIVDSSHIASAVSLNAGVYNGARIIGPALAGLLIGFVGIGGAFIINGLSFLAFLIGIHVMKLDERVIYKKAHPFDAIKEGLSFAFNHPVIKPLLFIAALNAIFGWSYITVMPILAKDIYFQGPDGLGFLQASAGLGAVVAAILVSATSGHVKTGFFVFGGTLVFATSLLALSFNRNFIFGIGALFFMGFGLLSIFAMVNSTIQQMSNNEVRGRVMSIYTFMFVGSHPIGSILIGYMTENIGIMNAFRFNAFVLLVGLAVMMYTTRNVPRLQV